MNRYRMGYRAELAVVSQLKARREFHTVIRSAGSRSAFDVVAIGRSRILLCQVKSGYGSFTREADRLRRLPVPDTVSKELRVYRDRTWSIIPL